MLISVLSHSHHRVKRFSILVTTNPSQLKYLFNILCLFLLSLAPILVSAEEQSEEERFQIEYILFTHRSNSIPEQSLSTKDYSLKDHPVYTHLVSDFEPLTSNQYPLLKQDVMFLKEPLRKLKRSRDVTVVNYGAWQQIILPESTLLPIGIDELINVNTQYNTYQETRLKGSLIIKRSRYLHIDANLFLSDFQFYPPFKLTNWLLNINGNSSLISLLSPYAAHEIALQQHHSLAIPMKIHKLNQSRRLKYGEVHYLDHPAIGLIITINKLEPEPEL